MQIDQLDGLDEREGNAEPETKELSTLDGLMVLGSGYTAGIDFTPSRFEAVGITIEYLANDVEKTTYRTIVQVNEGTIFQQHIRADNDAQT